MIAEVPSAIIRRVVLRSLSRVERSFKIAAAKIGVFKIDFLKDLGCADDTLSSKLIGAKGFES